MLKMQSEITTKDLSYLLGIRQQSLNELLNKLEKGGYVTRVPLQADKRVMVVQLTEKGKNEQYLETDFSNIFGCLSKDEQIMFGEYLDRVISALEIQLPIEEEDVSNWMQTARSRMGDGRFERMMSMCDKFGKMWRGSFAHGCCDITPDESTSAPNSDDPMPEGCCSGFFGGFGGEK
jgi:DNA-binding MarR family transcriptional regulator